jgi:Na+/melibiose symporter-like transporter
MSMPEERYKEDAVDEPTDRLVESPKVEIQDLRLVLSLYQIIQLNLFWFGYNCFWFMTLIVIFPSQIEEIVGNDWKGSGLALVSLVSGFFNLFLAPVFGYFNDKSNFLNQYGKRKPWLAIGSLGMCIFLFMLWGFDPLWVYTLAYLGLTVSSIICSVPFNGLLADLTPTSQKGRVSAIMGAMNLTGFLVGALLGTLYEIIGPAYCYLIMSGILISTTCVTLFCIKEPLQDNIHTSRITLHIPSFFQEIIAPLKRHRNFRLVFFGRFTAQLGINTCQQFIQYWIADCVSITMSPTTAVSIAFIPLLVISPIAALFIPKHKRKIVVYVSSVLMIITCIMMMFVTSFPLALVVASVFGLGYGPYLSCEFAMLLEVLPNIHESAKDISLWHSAMYLVNELKRLVSFLRL